MLPRQRLELVGVIALEPVLDPGPTEALARGGEGGGHEHRPGKSEPLQHRRRAIEQRLVGVIEGHRDAAARGSSGRGLEEGDPAVAALGEQ
jgi:hypothetical protein